jgi:hypothetical protein
LRPFSSRILLAPALLDPIAGFDAGWRTGSLDHGLVDLSTSQPGCPLDARRSRFLVPLDDDEPSPIPDVPDSILDFSRWRPIITAAWSYSDPVHLLEGRVRQVGLRHSARNIVHHGHRVVSLGDNEPEILVSEKGGRRISDSVFLHQRQQVSKSLPKSNGNAITYSRNAIPPTLEAGLPTGV